MLKRKSAFNLLLGAAFLLAGLFCQTFAESTNALNEKIKLESEMEARLKHILVPLVGTSDIIAIVKLNLINKNIVMENQGKSANDGTIRKWDESDEIVLPGVPAAASMTKKVRTEEAKKDVTGTYHISNIKISVIIGKSISQEKIEKSKLIITEMFGIDTEAGDSLSIETFKATFNIFETFKPGELIALATLLIFIFFVFGPLRSFLRTFNVNLKMIGEDRQKENIGDEYEEKAESHASRESSVAERIASNSPVNEEKQSFSSFINEQNIEDLKLVLAEEPAVIIARVVQNLPPKLAFAAIPHEKRDEVISLFTKTEFDDPEKVQLLLEKIKVKVQGSFGGAPRLSKLIQSMGKSAQDVLLEEVRKNYPEFAKNVEKKLFRFEDLLNYDDQSLRRIFRKAGTEAFTKCLKNISEETAKLFNEKLGQSISDIIANRINTVVAVKDDSEPFIRILHAVDDLNKSGFIVSLEDIKSSQG